MGPPPKVMIVTGEASGDLHASRLVRAFKKRRPESEIYGVGGNNMREAGVKLIRNINDLSTFGIFEVVKHLPRIAGVFFEALNSIKRERPDVIVLVDYPDFNIRLARFIKWKYGKTPPILYYIAPQVWIWRRNRAKTITGLVDKLAVVLPFEKKLFENFGADVHFVGHPLLGIAKESRESLNGLVPFKKKGAKKIALLPGSRRGELENYMPPIMDAIRTLKNTGGNYEFVIIKAPTLEKTDFERYLNENTQEVTLIEGPTRAILKSADFAVVALGTATLEAALAGAPAVLIGKVAPMTYQVGKRFLGMDLDYYGLVNFILERAAFPELIQDDCNGVKMAEVIGEITESDKAMTALKKACGEVRRKLEIEAEKFDSCVNASQRVAAILDNMISENRK